MHNSFYVGFSALNLPNEVHTHRRQVRAFVSPPFICPEGKDHCPNSHEERKLIKEWVFLAAVQGCLPCVQHCFEEIGPDFVQSDNSELTVLDWAQRGVDQAVDGAQEVVGYLVAASNTYLPIAYPVESSSSSRSRCEQLGSDLFDAFTPHPERRTTLPSTDAVAPPPPPLPSSDDFSLAIVPFSPGGIPVVVPFEGGKHLCKTHKPKTKSRQDVLKYWFFGAVNHSCQRCVAFCVNKHGIDINVVSDNNAYTAQDFASYNDDAAMEQFLKTLDV